MNKATQAVGFKKIYLEPENKSLSEIMSNSKSYVIPRFQRDYSWEHTNLEELWQDIEQMLESKIQHFMGYLVFQTDDGQSFQVIDGQQRLTTISLLIAAVLNRFQVMIDGDIDADKNRQRFDAYLEDYLGVLDTVTLERSAKLVLNRHNDSHFRHLIKDMEIPRHRNITETNRKMNRAFEFFKAKLNEFDRGEALASLINSITNGLMFTTITVKDDLNAYLVFETLNARGIQLSAPDLLKNYLLSTMAVNQQIHDSAFDNFEEQWEDILKQLGQSNFTSFLRSYIGMKHRLPYKKELYRVLKRQITDTAEVMPYLEDLTRNAPVYTALQNYQDDFWREYGEAYTAAQEHLEVLCLFNVTTPLSLLMAAYSKFAAHEFIKILRWITIISIRYNVIGNKPAKDQETVYNQIANNIMADRSNATEIAHNLKPLYLKDTEFHQHFADKTMPSRQSSKKIMFLLRRIERHLSMNQEIPSASLTLEHVLPYNPEEHWQEAFGRQNYERAIDCLGNMAILPDSRNMAQQPFHDKRQRLKESGYRINQNIAKYSEWTMDSLQEHQSWLADQAQTIWRADALE